MTSAGARPILVIRYGNLGDVIATFPLAEHLRATNTAISIDFLTRSEYIPLVSRSAWPKLGRIIEISDLAALSQFLSSEEVFFYDLCIDLHGGYMTPKNGLGWRYVQGTANRPFLEQYLAIIASAGVFIPRTPVPSESLICTDQLKSIAQDVKKRLGIKAPYTLIHPFTSRRAKNWPLRRFRSLISTLIAQTPLTVVICGTKKQVTASHACLPKRIHANDRVMNAVGQLDLTELAALTLEAESVIAGDTGALHLSAALQTPFIGLYGPTMPTVSGPFIPSSWSSPRAYILQGKQPPYHYYYERLFARLLMLSVSVNDVYNLTLSMLRVAGDAQRPPNAPHCFSSFHRAPVHWQKSENFRTARGIHHDHRISPEFRHKENLRHRAAPVQCDFPEATHEALPGLWLTWKSRIAKSVLSFLEFV